MSHAEQADRMLQRAESLYRALYAGDSTLALRTARDLRAGLDGLVHDLTAEVFGLKPDSEVSA